MKNEDEQPSLPNIWPWGGVTSRERLIAALAKTTEDGGAVAVVDALDVYLSEGDDRMPVPFLGGRPPPERVQVETLRQERDAALARAEKAEKALREAPRAAHYVKVKPSQPTKRKKAKR